MELAILEAREYVKANYTRRAGEYDPSKYVMVGWLRESEEEVLRILIKRAHDQKVAARKASQEAHKEKHGHYLSKHDLSKIGRGIDNVTGMRKDYLRTARWDLRVPELIVIGDGVFTRSNSHSTASHMALWDREAVPVERDAVQALRKFQKQFLPG